MRKDEMSNAYDNGDRKVERTEFESGRDTNNKVVQVRAKSELSTRHYFNAPINLMREPHVLSPEELEARKIISPAGKNRKAINAFRELRTKLLKAGGHTNFITMVSSVSEQGGASFVALNLAAAFAFDHSKTALLIDCNLRTPSIHKILGIAPEYGVTDHLENPDITIEKIIYSSGIPRLRVIPVGTCTDSGSEYFTSYAMAEFLHQVQRRYPDRYIIVDAPHLGEGASPDAAILSDLCDQIIMVVPYAKVTPVQVRDAVNSVQGEKVAGMVMNN